MSSTSTSTSICRTLQHQHPDSSRPPPWPAEHKRGCTHAGSISPSISLSISATTHLPKVEERVRAVDGEQAAQQEEGAERGAGLRARGFLKEQVKEQQGCSQACLGRGVSKRAWAQAVKPHLYRKRHRGPGLPAATTIIPPPRHSKPSLKSPTWCRCLRKPANRTSVKICRDTVAHWYLQPRCQGPWR